MGARLWYSMQSAKEISNDPDDTPHFFPCWLTVIFAGVFPSLRCSGYRQRKSKTRTLANFARQPDFAAVQLDELLRQG
jgi:hypothetical protein